MSSELRIVLTQDRILELASKVSISITSGTGPMQFKVWGIPESGVPAAEWVSAALIQRGHQCERVDSPRDANLIIDDLVDSGATMNRYMEKYPEAIFAALLTKVTPMNGFTKLFHYFGEVLKPGHWVTFPWDLNSEGVDTSAHDSVVRMLQYIGEDPSREGLLETPKRVVKAWDEWFSGYRVDPASLLKTFQDGAEGVNEMVLLTDIPVFSYCEHHIAPFTGVANVAYIPNGRIVGLSKIARVVDAFSRRLQVQERLTNQIADCLLKELNPLGVGVTVVAKHSCMSTRGVKVHGVDTTTSALRGVFLTDPMVRNEFMHLVK